MSFSTFQFWPCSTPSFSIRPKGGPHGGKKHPVPYGPPCQASLKIPLKKHALTTSFCQAPPESKLVHGNGATTNRVPGDFRRQNQTLGEGGFIFWGLQGALCKIRLTHSFGGVKNVLNPPNKTPKWASQTKTQESDKDPCISQMSLTLFHNFAFHSIFGVKIWHLCDNFAMQTPLSKPIFSPCTRKWIKMKLNWKPHHEF